MKNFTITAETIAAFFVLVISGTATIQTENVSFLVLGIVASVALAVINQLDSYNRIR